MTYHPKVGDIIKMRSWHGVVLKVFTNTAGSTILQAQTARSFFRGMREIGLQQMLAAVAAQ